MGAIQFTDRGGTSRVRHETRMLTQAAVAALPAPSVFNSQPWRWRISDRGAELRADRGRQLRSMDPDGRMLTVSCGIALHHVLTSLASQGAEVRVERFPDADDPDCLAQIEVVGSCPPDPAAARLASIMAVRHTDRRPFADSPVPDALLERLRAAAESVGAHLHLLQPGEVVSLTSAASRAMAIEFNDPACRAEIEAWTHRDDRSADGLDATIGDGESPVQLPRPVPLRVLPGGAEPPPATPSLADRWARYAVLFTDRDEPADWLAAGQALSLVLLTATEAGLSASPMSETVEVPVTRCLLRRLLSSVGHPVIAIRLGLASTQTPPEATTLRRPADDIIELVASER
ncbi:MAG: nitroreductase family protein [Micromonosporaceae bacterium]|nr:nitroreductase family protein [Micromonosporaceae bacterium]